MRIIYDDAVEFAEAVIRCEKTASKGKCEWCPFYDRCLVCEFENRHILCAEIEQPKSDVNLSYDKSEVQE